MHYDVFFHIQIRNKIFNLNSVWFLSPRETEFARQQQPGESEGISPTYYPSGEVTNRS